MKNHTSLGYFSPQGVCFPFCIDDNLDFKDTGSDRNPVATTHRQTVSKIISVGMKLATKNI